jgi:hypothetical protein
MHIISHSILVWPDFLNNTNVLCKSSLKDMAVGPMCPLLWFRYAALLFSEYVFSTLPLRLCSVPLFLILKDIYHFVFLKTHNFLSFGMEICKSSPCWFFVIVSDIFLIKVKWSHYRPGVARSVGRGIALLFHVRGTRRGWVVSSMPQPHFTPRKDLVHILQEAGWAPGPVWTGRKYRPHWSPYRLSYPAHTSFNSLYIKILYIPCIMFILIAFI